MACLARLTSWEKTSFRIDSCFTVSHVVLCKNMAVGTLCKECMARPTESKYHSRMIHGLLTEPIPMNSSIYGGPVYWAKMKKFEDAGKILSADAKMWIEKAEEAQSAAEERGGIKVQRLSAKMIERMARAKAVAKDAKEVKEVPKVSLFKPVEVRFSESEKTPVRMETDTMGIKLEVVDGVSMWIAENGMMFENVKGEIGELIG